MTCKELLEKKYLALQRELNQKARKRPLCPTYEVDLNINGKAYTLFLQMGRNNEVYALYALHAVYERDVEDVSHEQIDDPAMLSALLELVLWQGL